MGYVENPNPPWAPYGSSSDCSQRICSVYCHQWCYLIFTPPPSSFLYHDAYSSSHFSPFLIALFGILSIAFLFVSYYTLISKFCRLHGSSSHGDRDFSSFSAPVAGHTWQAYRAPEVAEDGLEESLIKSIKVYKYMKSDGFVHCSDCSVCLSQFQENESLKLLPKCNHAFHVPCIDTWLKSHSNCPLCRANLTAVNAAAPAAVADQPIAADSGNSSGGNVEINTSTGNYQQQSSDPVVVIIDLESVSRNENNSVASTPKRPERESRDGVMTRGEEEPQQIQRSMSLNSGGVVSIADILRETEDEEEDEESEGVETSHRRAEEEEEEEEESGKAATAEENQRDGVSNFLVRSPMAMTRSISTGFTVYPIKR